MKGIQFLAQFTILYVYSLKAPDMSPYLKSPSYTEAREAYVNVMKLVQNSQPIPELTLQHGEELLKKLKSSVIDFYSLTSLHFLYAGFDGICHFVFLINSILSCIKSSSLEELNSIWATILYKGGKKDPEVDRSYRSISCCPVIAKVFLLAGSLPFSGLLHFRNARTIWTTVSTSLRGQYSSKTNDNFTFLFVAFFAILVLGHP